ncbi:MAG: LysE family transporter [Actinomycetota bacterium]
MAAAAETAASLVGALGLGLALASAPGPVQAVLLSESVRGGIAPGLRAMAGASAAFGTLLVSLALGLSVAAPSGAMLRVLQVAGGALLLWFAVDGFRSARDADRRMLEEASASGGSRRRLPPAARGALAIVLNPPAWIFLGAVAAPLLASVAELGGTSGAILAAFALLVGAAAGDALVVLLGGLGLRRAGPRTGRWVRWALAALLAAFGVAVIAAAFIE